MSKRRIYSKVEMRLLIDDLAPGDDFIVMGDNQRRRALEAASYCGKVVKTWVHEDGETFTVHAPK